MGFVLSIVLLLVLTGSLIRSVRRTNEAKVQIKKTENRIEKAKAENEKLRDKLEFTQSQQFIEEQLRDKLGLAKEGEIVLVLPDEETLKRLAPDIPEEEEEKPLPNWRKWVNLLL